MSIEIILDVFSGRENPRWVLSDDMEKEFFEKLDKIDRPTLSKPSGSIGTLGYRGFKIRRPVESPQQEVKLFVSDGIVDFGQDVVNRASDGRQLEQWLLESGSQKLDDSIRSHVNEQLEKPVKNESDLLSQYKGGVCPACEAKDAPLYDPNMWNVEAVKLHNNCYNYANNQSTNTFAQPGLAHGQQYTEFDCPNVQKAAIADKLVTSANFSDPLSAGQGWYVALVIWPGVDYHWYRQDQNGCWSHKPGQTAVINTDNSGQRITDPRTCDRGPYRDFCTYMITNSNVVIT